MENQQLENTVENLTASLVAFANSLTEAFIPIYETIVNIMNTEGMKALIQMLEQSEMIEASIDQAESFIDFLEKLKAAFGLDYDQELAKLLNIRIDQLSLLLAGRRLPNTRYLNLIFEALNIQPDSQPYYKLLALAHKARLKENE